MTGKNSKSRRLRLPDASAATCPYSTSTSVCLPCSTLWNLIARRSPTSNTAAHATIGIIEGGVCNAENVHVLHEFRKNCKILIAIGACAINGGLPAQRNHLDLSSCLTEVYLTEPGLAHGHIPNDPELPLPLDKVHPLHEVVKIDYFIPGCPPSADAIWKFLTDLIAGKTPELGHGLIKYD